MSGHIPQPGQGPESQPTTTLCSNKITLPAVAPELPAQSKIMATILVQAENHQSEAKVHEEHPQTGPSTPGHERGCRALVVLYSLTQTHSCQKRNIPVSLERITDCTGLRMNALASTNG